MAVYPTAWMKIYAKFRIWYVLDTPISFISAVDWTDTLSGPLMSFRPARNTSLGSQLLSACFPCLSKRFGALSFSKFHFTRQKNPSATPRTVLHRAKTSLCNRSQFLTLFLPHRFIKIRPSRHVSIEFCWIPEFPGMNPKRKSCGNVWTRRKRTAVQRKSHRHLKKSFGMRLNTVN